MRPSSRDEFAIAIVCALSLEAEAVEALFDETYDRLSESYKKQPGDDNAYFNGRIGNHLVVLCLMPRMGKGNAASVAASLKISYRKIQMALVVGICGGAPCTPDKEEIFLGDVIISDAVVEYDFGRQYRHGFERKTGVKDTHGRPTREIQSLLAGLRPWQASDRNSHAEISKPRCYAIFGLSKHHNLVGVTQALLMMFCMKRHTNTSITVQPHLVRVSVLMKTLMMSVWRL
jgi:nucleoside phosphorylase